MRKVLELPLPVQPSHLPDGVSGGWLQVISGLGTQEMVNLLQSRWSVFQVPYLKNLAAAILGRQLRCLSIDSQGNQWLSFGDGDSSMHVAPPSKIPQELHSGFPFQRIPGLVEFMENFSGLANWQLPPCPWFTSVDDCRVVVKDCSLYDWGKISDWAGSLPLYNTLGGNCIVISPDNVCAKWEHEIGWSGDVKDPFFNLNWTMSDLVREFIAYLSLGETEAKESPFYY